MCGMCGWWVGGSGWFSFVLVSVLNICIVSVKVSWVLFLLGVDGDGFIVLMLEVG